MFYAITTYLNKPHTNQLWDFHEMIVAAIKLKFKKISLKEILYREYKNFNQDQLWNDRRTNLNKNISDYDSFEKIFIEVLDKHKPIKRKFLKDNNVPYLTITLRKAIMRRPELETKHFTTKTQKNWNWFKKQRNFCSNLYKNKTYSLWCIRCKQYHW